MIALREAWNILAFCGRLFLAACDVVLCVIAIGPESEHADTVVQACRKLERTAHVCRAEYEIAALGQPWGVYECLGCKGGRANILPRCPDCGMLYDPSRRTPVQRLAEVR